MHGKVRGKDVYKAVEPDQSRYKRVGGEIIMPELTVNGNVKGAGSDG